jgi:hypothetical protein
LKYSGCRLQLNNLLVSSLSHRGRGRSVFVAFTQRQGFIFHHG